MFYISFFKFLFFQNIRKILLTKIKEKTEIEIIIEKISLDLIISHTLY